MLFACDRKWWLAWYEIAQAKFDGELWTVNDQVKAFYPVHVMLSERGGGKPKHPDRIRQGGNSGFQAAQSAAEVWRARRTILLGFDMKSNAGRMHWHADHHGELHNPLKASFVDWRDCFGKWAKETTRVVLNATRDTALDCFPLVELESVLCTSHCKKRRTRSTSTTTTRTTKLSG